MAALSITAGCCGQRLLDLARVHVKPETMIISFLRSTIE
jgi:hypothetical protein